MKIGVRKPSIKKTISSRTTGRMKRAAKRSINPVYGKKGVGLVTNPRKAAYNAVYHRTTIGVGDVAKGMSSRKIKYSKDDNYSYDEEMAPLQEIDISDTYNRIDEDKIMHNDMDVSSITFDEIDLDTGEGIDYDNMPQKAYKYFVEHQISNPLLFKDQIPDIVLLEADLSMEQILGYTSALFDRHPELMDYRDEYDNAGWTRYAELVIANDERHGRNTIDSHADESKYDRIYSERPKLFKVYRASFIPLLIFFLLTGVIGIGISAIPMIIVSIIGLACTIVLRVETSKTLKRKSNNTVGGELNTEEMYNNSFERK